MCGNVKCGGKGTPICKVERCTRNAYKDGMCRNVKCTGKVRVQTPILCSFGGCTNQSQASGKNSKGRPGMKGRCIIHLGGPRCLAEGCPYGAERGTGACIGHKGGIRCECNLYSVKSHGFKCSICRRGTERAKQLEALVKDFLNKHEFLKMYTCTDVRFGCDNNRRPDFVYLVAETHVIIIEVDEDAHRYYNRDCEITRVSELMQTCDGKPLFLIRFNPLVTVQGELKNTEELKSTFDAFRTVQVTAETPMLTVQFIGYKQEYDVAAEMDRVAKERAAAAEEEMEDMEEEMEESEEEEESEDMEEDEAE